MAAGNPQDYLALVAEMENLKTKFSSLELENQRLLEDLHKVTVEKQQIHDEFTRRVQQLESAIVSLQQLKMDGQGVLKEPKISLPAKFDGSRAHFRGFINQVRLVIQMHPMRYPTDSSRVGLVGTLLTGTTLSWFAPLLEANSPLLNNFEEFIKEFKACFGDTDSVRTAINKIRTLRQGDQPASTYASNFRLIASDIPWDEQALMEQFRSGLRSDVKDLLLTFPEDPKSLTEAISRAVRCDNRLFERRSERQQQQTRSRFTPTYASVTAQSPRQQYNELSQRVHELELALVSLRQQASNSQNLFKEPKICLSGKFDGTRSQFRGFLNQVRLVIHMHPSRYPTDSSRVGLVGTLLSGTALAWFAPLLEKESPLLNNFEDFIKEFQASFGDTDSVRTAINKLRRLRQGDRPASAYASNFCLVESDISWDEEALMDQFCFKLRNDVKDLFLTFHEDPRSLTKPIS